VDAPEVLARLDFPRENASPGLEQARAVLERAIRAAGLVPEPHEFAYHARSDGVAAALVAAAILLFAVSWKRRRRWLGAAAAATLLAAAAGAGGLDALLPATRQASLQVILEPSGPARNEIVLAAHYDSKTELFDHVQRSVLLGVAAALALATVVVVVRGGTAARPLASAAALALLLTAAHLQGHRFVRTRSHGIVDDGAACALLVELATRMPPLHQTRVRCVWFAGEEAGAQGSAAFVREMHGFRSAPRPRVVNLEGVGAGPDVAFAACEWTAGGPRAADARLVADIRRAAPGRVRKLSLPVWTDAGPFLDSGLAAVTLVNLPQGASTIRGLHSGRDQVAALDRRGLDATRAVLAAFLAQTDSAQTSR
jgi:peptidase M28-like protein